MRVLAYVGPCTSSRGGESLFWDGVLSCGPGNAGSAKGEEIEVLGSLRRLKEFTWNTFESEGGAEEWVCLLSIWDGFLKDSESPHWGLGFWCQVHLR